MKSRILAIAILISLLLCGCNADGIAEAQENEAAEQSQSSGTVQVQQYAEQNEDEMQHYTIEGIAMSCTNGTVFILSDLGGAYHELMPISMSAADGDSSIFDGLAAGDKIKIEIEIVEETYPAHTYVYSLEKTGSGSIDNIPADLIARLEEMGYTAEENVPAVTSNVSIENKELCMLGGVVYCNTGETNNTERCGMFDGMFDEVIAEGEFPAKDGQANFSSYGFQWGMEEYTIEVCIDDNWYIFKPLIVPTVNIPIEGYPHFKYDTVSRITIIPEFQIAMGKEPFEVPEGIKQDLAKMIEVCEAVPTEKPTEELTGGGYIVTVYNSEGKTIEYNFWNEEIFVVDGIYYSTARAYGENIISAIISVILEAEAAEKVSEIKVDEITPLSKEEDQQIRTDYAAYVSSRHKVDDSGASGTSRLVTADDVHGEFYFGTYDGYMIVVMCPSEMYTTDIGRVKLRYTDADIIDPSCDCYPYIDVDLPSGMFELLAYKDGAFITVEKALETKMIDYSAASIIGDYMDAYYQGKRTCAYNVS